jgi:hypothetical protein
MSQTILQRVKNNTNSLKMDFSNSFTHELAKLSRETSARMSKIAIRYMDGKDPAIESEYRKEEACEKAYDGCIDRCQKISQRLDIDVDAFEQVNEMGLSFLLGEYLNAHVAAIEADFTSQLSQNNTMMEYHATAFMKDKEDSDEQSYQRYQAERKTLVSISVLLKTVKGTFVYTMLKDERIEEKRAREKKNDQNIK